MKVEFHGPLILPHISDNYLTIYIILGLMVSTDTLSALIFNVDQCDLPVYFMVHLPYIWVNDLG